jgi:hypothetical protein
MPIVIRDRRLMEELLLAKPATLRQSHQINRPPKPHIVLLHSFVVPAEYPTRTRSKCHSLQRMINKISDSQCEAAVSGGKALAQIRQFSPAAETGVGAFQQWPSPPFSSSNHGVSIPGNLLPEPKAQRSRRLIGSSTHSNLHICR